MTTPVCGRRLFRFVVVADTHVNPEDGVSSSPFAVNAHANARAQAAVADVDRWAPAFVVHLGDLVHPVPELPSFEPACGRFKAIAQAVRAPLHVIPGNHDVGDKRVDWMPAGTVTQHAVERYRELFGPDFYAFDAEGCRGIAINAQVINSGLPAEAEQRAWLEAEFEANAGRRIFFFTHYPPYVSERGEPSSYDNIDEPGRSWLLRLIERYRPEALFAGHVHHQWYDRHAETDLYILPSTAFVRQDYTELFKVAPLREYGRDDATKLGYYVVDVHERGHVAHFIRTGGAARPEDVLASAAAPSSPVHTKTNPYAPAGVDMRHAWIEWLDVAATGGVQEFERKRTRNDYPAVALWEMGAQRLRVPLQDVMDAPVRERMRLLATFGHRYTAYCFGLPRPEALEVMREHPGLVDALEVVVTWHAVDEILARLAPLHELGVRILLSKLRRHEDAKFDGSRFNHFINHGFVAAEREQLAQALALPRCREIVDGFVLRVPQGRSPWQALHESRALAAELGVRLPLQVRLAADNPAEPVIDDARIAGRVAETVFAALCVPDAEVYFDTFVDVDRNYFPHHGFVDRRYDPRAASYVYRYLHAALADHRGAMSAHADGVQGGLRWFAAETQQARWYLLEAEAAAAAFVPPHSRDRTRRATCTALTTGAQWQPGRDGQTLQIGAAALAAGPVLVRLD